MSQTCLHWKNQLGAGLVEVQSNCDVAAGGLRTGEEWLAASSAWRQGSGLGDRWDVVT
jgi:hypothetical protein